MAKEANIATQKKLGEAITNGNFDEFDEIFAPSVIDHDPAPNQESGPDGFKNMFRSMKDAFPDLAIKAEQMVVDDDNVCVAYTMTGTHKGEFQGVAPTGKAINARGVQIARFENGMIVERWGSSDELGIVKQLTS